MNLFPALEKRYSKERQSALDAQRLAHEISFGPIVFQVSRLMIKFGILQMLIDSEKGLTLDEITANIKTGHAPSLQRYACQCLLESSLTIGTVLFHDGKFTCSKAGWFLLNDPLVRVDMDFNHDVNYLGWFHLEEALLNGKADFPQGSFALAATFDVPIIAVFVMKKSVSKYHVYVRPLSVDSSKPLNKREKISGLAQSFATELENIVRKHPEQWFNFYEFWK